MRISAANIALFLVTLVLCWTIAELAIAEINPRMKKAPWVYDEDLVWRYTPDYRTRTSVFNDEGFRDRDHDVANVDNATRIAFIGDSYTAATQINRSYIFTSRLDEMLNEGSQETFELFNFGVDAYGTDQEYLILKKEALKYRPDVVILTVAPNDIREAYAKGLLYIDELGELRRDETNKAYNLDPLDRLLWYAAARSRIVNNLLGAAGKEYGSFSHISNDVVAGLSFEDDKGLGADKVLFLREETAEMKEAVKLFGKLVGEMDALCLENGCRLVLVNLPIKPQFEDPALEGPEFDQRKIGDIVASAAEENDIPYLDLYPAVSKHEDPLDLYIDWEYHLDEDGHEFVSRELQRFLKGEFPALFSHVASGKSSTASSQS